jgi:predicted DsbA family dithiol-disulfide isomerase
MGRVAGSRLMTGSLAAERPRVEVFADIVCPFTHVGLSRLVARREALGREDVALRVRAWPLELINGEPMDPGFIAEEVDVLRASVAPDLFVHFDPDNFPTTSMPGLAFAAAADRVDPALGERVSLGLREAMFEEGRDVSDPEVIAEVGRRFGFEPPGGGSGASRWDEEPVVDDWREGTDRGVKGSPHYFVGHPGSDETDADYFCPSLRITRPAGHLAVSLDTKGFEELVSSCFV